MCLLKVMLYFGKHFRYKMVSVHSLRSMYVWGLSCPLLLLLLIWTKKNNFLLCERSLHSSGEALWMVHFWTMPLRYIAFFFIASISLYCLFQFPESMLHVAYLYIADLEYTKNIMSYSLLSQCCSLKSITSNIRASPPSWQVWIWSPVNHWLFIVIQKL